MRPAHLETPRLGTQDRAISFPSVYETPGQSRASPLKLGSLRAGLSLIPQTRDLHPRIGLCSPLRLIPPRTGPGLPLSRMSRQDWTLHQSKTLGQGPLAFDLEPPGQGRPAHSERPRAAPAPSRCWQRKWEPSGGLAGSQDPVCLEQRLKPGGHFSLQGLPAQPSHREHVNTSRAGRRQAGRRAPRDPSSSASLARVSGTSWAALNPKWGR